MRGLRHAALLLALCATTAVPVRASEPWTVADTYSAMQTHSALADCVVGYETGFTYEPYSIGAAQEVGIAQLKPNGGRLDDFFNDGYDDPFDPYQALDYLDAALAAGEGHYWSGYWRCI